MYRSYWDARRTHAIRRLAVTPVHVRINPTRTSLKARASRVNLSYFSCKTGTRSMNNDKNIPATEIKMANPDRPAEKLSVHSTRRVQRENTYMGLLPNAPGN
jgi:hypothetical protein